MISDAASRLGDAPSERRIAVLIGIGGAIGSAARYAVGLTLPARGFPFTVVIGQLIACLVLGAFLAVIRHSDRHRWTTANLLGIGTLGGFTALGGYAVAGVVTQPPAFGLLVLIGLPILSLLAVIVGYRLCVRYRRHSVSTVAGANR